MIAISTTGAGAKKKRLKISLDNKQNRFLIL